MLKPNSSIRNSALVSIIMPAYNASKYIGSAVNSAVAQTYRNWELIIVDDASADNTVPIVQQLVSQDPRITLLRQPHNQGVAKARNLALSAARGKYIAFLDSDDLWMEDKLEKQIGFMEEEKVLICCSNYLRIDETGKVTGSVQPPAKFTYKTLLKSNFIGNLTGIYNAEVLGKQYFSAFKHEDYVAWLALIKKAGSARSLAQTLGSYRVYSNSTSANKIKAISWQWRIYREAETLGLVQSCWLMICYGYHALRKRM